MLQIQSMLLSDCGQSSINNVCTWIHCLCSDQSINNVSAYGAADAEQHPLFTYVILSKIKLLGDAEETELLNIVIIFVCFLLTKSILVASLNSG